MKRRVEELAIFGGPPAFSEALHVGRPNVGNRAAVLRRIDSALERRWLTNNGPLVQEFENRVATLLSVRHCIAMCNGTVALEIAARAVGLAGEVIVPSFTFVATAHALQWQSITPVFCDVTPDTHTIDPVSVERLITSRTTGIIGVHLWGGGCDVAALTSVATRHGLRLLFDAAHAFGCTVGGRMIGNFGEAEVFSFHATKFLNTFEGGAVTTNNDELAARLRLMRNFGFAGYDHVVSVGTNGKMNEIAAAMGLVGLDEMDAIIARNRQNLDEYRRALNGVAGIELRDGNLQELSNYQYVVLVVDPLAAGLNRDTLLAVLHAENVIARRYFYPGCHQMEPYRSANPEAGASLPVTESLVTRVLCLPTGTSIDSETIQRVGDIIRLAVEHAAEVVERLRETPTAQRV